MKLDEGHRFENEIRQFLRDVGFSDAPPLHPDPGSTFNLGGQEIDAFGRDGDFYVVVDAKSASLPKGRDVRRHLSIINGYKGEVIKDIKKRYEREHGFRGVVFIFWTKNIKISEDDKRRAKELGIALRDDHDLLYYKQALGMLNNKDIVRNGFLKDLALQLDIDVFPKGHTIVVNAIRVNVGAQEIYTFPLQVRYLLKFAYVFRVELNNILGESYQRLLNKRKLKSIKKFITEKGGYFPNNILAASEISLKDRFKQIEEEGGAVFALGELSLPDKPCYLEILDGQHRLYGYSDLQDKQNDYLWVTVIEPLNHVKRAELFVTINRKQTPVPPKILWDLYRIIDLESTYGKVSEFVYKLNEDGPLQDLISLPRVRSSKAFLSFPNICDTLSSRTKLYSNYKDNEERFMKVLKAYLEAISSDPDLKDDWNRCVKSRGRRGFICTNNSMSVLLRLLEKVLSKTELPGSETISLWKNKLKEWVINPLKDYLEENKSHEDEADPYKRLRGRLTSEKARRDAANDIWKKSPLSQPNADASY